MESSFFSDEIVMDFENVRKELGFAEWVAGVREAAGKAEISRVREWSRKSYISNPTVTRF